MVEWRDWMEQLDFLYGPAPVWARPVGLGALGSESYFVEPYKIGSPHRVHVGNHTMIGPRSHFAVVEDYQDVHHESSLRIGDNTGINSDLFVACAGSVEIGSQVGISARVFICDAGRDYEDPEAPAPDLAMEEAKPVTICDGAIVGAGATVLAGVTVGERALVAAGAVVTRDVPPRSVAFGNPARVVRHFDERTGKWAAGPPRRQSSKFSARGGDWV